MIIFLSHTNKIYKFLIKNVDFSDERWDQKSKSDKIGNYSIVYE